MMAPKREILLDGLPQAQLLLEKDLKELVVIGKPIVFTVGTSEVLAEFSENNANLKAKIAVVDGGGEGVLPTLIDTVERAAIKEEFTAIEWSIYARNCSRPNHKLERVLQRFGFEIVKGAGTSEHYWQRVSTNASLMNRRP